MKSRKTYFWVIAICLVPAVLDFVFLESIYARISRIFLVAGLLATILMKPEMYTKSKLQGVGSIGLVGLLWLIGTYASIQNGGVATPNVILLFAVLFLASSNMDQYENILKALGDGIFLLVSLSLIAILFELNPRKFYSSSEGYPVFFDFIGLPGRNYGIFSHPNVLGQAAVLSICFILVSNKNKFLIAIPLLCLLKCGSRTSIVGLAIALTVFVVVTVLERNKNEKRRTQYPLVIATFIFLILLTSSAQFLSLINNLESGALTGRVAIWQTSLDIFKNNALLGSGWGWHERAIDSNLISVWAVSSHNTILEILFSGGFIGLILFLVLLGKSLAYFPSFSKLEKIIFVSILVSMISESYIDLQYPTLQTYLFYLMTIGAGRK